MDEVEGAQATDDFVLPVDPDVWEYISKQRKVELSSIRDAFQIDVIPMGGNEAGEGVFSVRIQPSVDSGEIDTELIDIAQQELAGFYESTSVNIYREYCTVPAAIDDETMEAALKVVQDAFTTVVSRKSDEENADPDNGQSYIFIGEPVFARPARIMFNQELGLAKGWWKTKRSFKKAEQNEEVDSSIESLEEEGNYVSWGQAQRQSPDAVDLALQEEDRTDMQKTYAGFVSAIASNAEPQIHQRKLDTDMDFNNEFDMFDRHVDETTALLHENDDDFQDAQEELQDNDDGFPNMQEHSNDLPVCPLGISHNAKDQTHQTTTVHVDDFVEVVDSDGEDVANLHSETVYKSPGDIACSMAELKDVSPNLMQALNEAQAFESSSHITVTSSNQIGERYKIPSIGIPSMDKAIENIFSNQQITPYVKTSLSRLDLNDVESTTDAINALLDAKDDECFTLMSCLLEREFYDGPRNLDDFEHVAPAISPHNEPVLLESTDVYEGDETEHHSSPKPTKKKVMKVFQFGRAVQKGTSSMKRGEDHVTNLSQQSEVMSDSSAENQSENIIILGDNSEVLQQEASEHSSPNTSQPQPNVDVQSPQILVTSDVNNPQSSHFPPVKPPTPAATVVASGGFPPPPKTLPKRTNIIPQAMLINLSVCENNTQRVVEREDGSILTESEGCLCISCADLITGSMWRLPCTHSVCKGCLSSLGKGRIKECTNCGEKFTTPG